MIFFEYFNTMISKRVVVVLKNGLCVSGVLASVDPFLNIRLEGVQVEENNPALATISHCSIRGSAIKMLRLPHSEELEVLLSDASRLRCCLGN